MKKLFIVIILLSIFLVGTVQAFEPPSGCDADSYIILTHTPLFSPPILSVAFYKNNVYKCEYDLPALAPGYTSVGNGEVPSTDTVWQNLIQTLLYVLMGIVLASVFLGGMYIINT